MLLEFEHVDTHYGDLHVLKDVSYAIEAGEIVALLGGNASGKSTTMKTIMGVVRPTRGRILFEGRALERLSVAARVRLGIAPVLEARRLFPRMTVYENLEMGAYTRPRGQRSRTIWTASTSCFRACANEPGRSRARCPAASSRWLRSAAR